MTNHPSPCTAAGAIAGFVLVGVVMIVLALTILGLSLFSLSSYEAQFMNRSLDGEQALQHAMSGLDRARFTLTVAPESLSNVKQNLPYEFVTYARATQDQGGQAADSMGVVIGGGNDVEIVVQSEYRGVVRRVQGRYQPVSQTNYYKRLFSVAAGGITVNDRVGDAELDARERVVLGRPGVVDSIWINNGNTQWQINAADMTPSGQSNYGVNPRYVPVPAVWSFITTPPLPPTPVQHGTATYSLLGSSGTVSYWYTHNPSPVSPYRFSSYFKEDATIRVQGLAVWMLPRGLRFDGLTTVRGLSGDDCLVIVARNGLDEDYDDPGAIWFFGGLDSDIPVILVSDGLVKIEQFGRTSGYTTVNNLCVFANGLLLTGPSVASGNFMRLAHGGAVMAPLIDRLMAAGALPNAVSNAPFALRPGTWRVVQ